MNAIILSVGDELVLGQTVDTNSAWISRQLAAVGCAVCAHMTVADDQSAIEHAIRRCAGDCDWLIVSGGIGPTADDLTRQALAAVMGVDLVLNAQWMARLDEFFAARGREMPEINKIQAMIPRGATMIDNTCGTAAGMRATLKGPGRGPCDIFIMPGVPKEMMVMFERDVLPAIREKSNGGVILSRTLHTFGFGESWVAEKLGDLMDRSRNPSVGTTVSNGIVSLRINSRFPTRHQAQRELEQTESACRAALGDLIFGADDETIQEVVAAMLEGRHVTVTTAESCTGGLLGKMLTDVPGSSEYFKQGWVTYSNEAKVRQLGVDPGWIKGHGAVSTPVVREMAKGAMRAAHADIGLAISGIAGPDGGTPEKPVGTVHIGIAFTKTQASVGSHSPVIEAHGQRFHFFGDREMVRDRAAKMALTMLRYHLLGKTMPV